MFASDHSLGVDNYKPKIYPLSYIEDICFSIISGKRTFYKIVIPSEHNFMQVNTAFDSFTAKPGKEVINSVNKE